MASKKPTVFIVCGPTASGKTAFALTLAKKTGAEILSVDSRQIYRGLDIVTGKDLPKKAVFQYCGNFAEKLRELSVGCYFIRGIPLWGYDLISPRQSFSAGEYAHFGRLVLKDIASRGKPAIIVGGSGLYLKALIEGLDTAGGPDWQLRRRLEKLPVVTLQKKLARVNPERLASMNHSDRFNPRRLIRALEIASKPQKNSPRKPLETTPNSRFWLFQPDPKTLLENIATRVEKRLRAGAVLEIKTLLKQGFSWSDPGFNTLGVKQLQPFFESQQSLNEAVSSWKKAEYQYAKRQLTWFKNLQNQPGWYIIKKYGRR